MTIKNTSHRDQSLNLLGAISDGLSGYITGMEAAGQRELVASDQLPADMGPEADWLAVGFAFGDLVDGDPLFRHASLPAGWKREGSDHAMGSNITDERGLRRVSIFYKAAFYDRKAHMTLVNVGRDVARSAIYGDGDPTIPWALLTSDERAAAVTSLTAYLEKVAEYPSIYGDHRKDRVDILLATAPETASQVPAAPHPEETGAAT